MLIAGTVKNIIYRNAENGYSVLELIDDAEHVTTAVGTLPLANAGERVELEGEWTEHRTYGRQFHATGMKTLAPSSIQSLISYLGSGLIAGVGEQTAKNIVAMFGMDTLDILEHEPGRLREVIGIGAVRAQKIASSFALQKDMRDIMLALQPYGVTVGQAMKLYKTYGNLCLSRLRENPYRLIDDIEGIGFITADKLAANMGLEFDSPFRLSAGLKYTLQWARQEGHTYLPYDKLVEVASGLLQSDTAPLERALEDALLSGRLVRKSIASDDAVFLPQMFASESDCARRFALMAKRREEVFEAGIDFSINALERELELKLAPLQRRAVKLAMSAGALVITGGPGTGKTTILRFVIKLLERACLEYELCAPTGRAAKRMTEATGAEARTIHRLLGYGFDGDTFVKNEDDPIDADVIIVDEMSMVDVPLMRALIRATPANARLIMVGDADQLPSVGPGNVLKDIIASKAAPVVQLNDIYRQAERGMIVENAHRINRGAMPELSSGSEDFVFERIDGAENAIRRLIALYTGKTNKLLTRDPQKDVQVIAPMRKGALGVVALNARLQQAVNPHSEGRREIKRGDVIFREGDKVMQIKNDYKLEWKRALSGEEGIGTGVFNGDLGTIVGVAEDDSSVEVLFDDERIAFYELPQLDELTLAYAVTIHKSQGSEFPVVLMPLIQGPPQLMTRSLLYTAVTRAREQVYIIGREECVYGMVENVNSRRRYSALCTLINEFEPLIENDGE